MKGGQVIDGPFDDAGNEQLQKVDNDQAGNAGQDGEAFFEKKRFY